MAPLIKTCYLQCVKDATKKIFLPDNKSIILGRNERTGITDTHVSRKHLECVARLDLKRVSVKVFGKCYSGCNNYALIMGETYFLKHHDIIEIRLGYHQYKVVFEPSAPIIESEEKESDKNIMKKFSIFDMKQSKNLEKNGQGTWENIDQNGLLIFTSKNCVSQSVIASFDLDGTIIKTKSGHRFPKDFNDWALNFSCVPEKLKELFDANYKIVIFTNQSGIGKDIQRINGFKEKVEKIISVLDLPVQVFIALGKSIYRKPSVGMWNALINFKNNIPIDISQCFYVGDAAGREKNWLPKKNKDHSIADRLFALNVGLKFYTPEEYFLKAKPVSFKMPEFDPRKLTLGQYPDFSCNEPNVVLMVGCQGSGKTYFCKSELVPTGYVHINRDSLGTWQKCIQVMEDSLQKKLNVVIDNTNPDKSSRQKYIMVAKKYKFNCRCFLMTTNFQHTKHNNRFRELTDKTHTPISDILLHTYRKNFEEPTLLEGFSEIVKIPFIPMFENDKEQELYKMFLLES